MRSAGSLGTVGVLTRASVRLTAGIDLVSSEMAKSVLHGLQLLLLYDTCRSHIVSASHIQVSEIQWHFGSLRVSSRIVASLSKYLNCKEAFEFHGIP